MYTFIAAITDSGSHDEARQAHASAMREINAFDDFKDALPAFLDTVKLKWREARVRDADAALAERLERE